MEKTSLEKMTLRKYLFDKNIVPQEDPDGHKLYEECFGTFLLGLDFDNDGILDEDCLDQEFSIEDLDLCYQSCIESGYIIPGKKSNDDGNNNNKKRCVRCGNYVSSYPFYSYYHSANILYDKDSDLCRDCFDSTLSKRDLTEKEIEILVSDYFHKMSLCNNNPADMPGLPGFLTSEQRSIVKSRIMEKEAKYSEEEYHKKAQELIERTGSKGESLIDVVAEILKIIDEKTASPHVLL